MEMVAEEYLNMTVKYKALELKRMKIKTKTFWKENVLHGI